MPTDLPPCPPLVAWVTACLAQAAPADKPAPPPVWLQYLPLVAIGLAAYLLLFRPERDRLRRQQAMLAGLKKNDRVVTAAGLYGTVAAVDRDADRVTLKVDDSGALKLTVTLASIARVLGGEAGESPGS